MQAVNFRYDLRRKGMVKDTIHTTELDTTYARGVKLLNDRKYNDALRILRTYEDRNTVVVHLSLGHDAQALELLAMLPKDAITEYLRAIACSRLGRKEEGRRNFLNASRMDERMEYRGNLDPEIAELMKNDFIMKKRRMKQALLYVIMAIVRRLLVASLFMGCNLYENEEVQIIRCPRIETDTVAVPEWESEQGDAAEDVGH